MESFVLNNIEYISVGFILMTALAKNLKVYRLKSAMTLSYKPYMFGVLASLVVLINSQADEIKMVMVVSLLSSLFTAIHIIYRKRGGCQTQKDDARIFFIALAGSSLGVFGSSLAYLSLVNLKKGYSSVSLVAISLGMANYALMLAFMAKDPYVKVTLSITIMLQGVILLATYYNNNSLYKTKK